VVVHTGTPLTVVAEDEELEAPEEELPPELLELELELPTRHDCPFSNPQPSPSGSVALDAHTGVPPEDEPLLDDELLLLLDEELLPMRQEVPFSQPQPSPSGSEDADWQKSEPDEALLEGEPPMNWQL
jgi:hypothetical protein